MRGHVHFDVAQAAWTLAIVVLGLHTMRMTGAYLSTHGAPKLGQIIGGAATFNT